VGLTSVISAITTVMLSLDRPLRPPHEVIEGVSRDLSQIVCKMLSDDPADRYQSAESAISDLVPCLYGRGVGPGSESLIAYLQLLDHTDLYLTKRKRRMLSFLEGPSGTLEVCPKWVLTPAAADATKEGLNPGRVY
jgi:hypothetical protein